MVLLAELTDRLGLTGELGRRADLGLARRGGSHAHHRGAVLHDLVVMLADGGDCLSDLAGLREQARLFGRVCSTATAWRVVHEVAADPRGMAALWSALARVRARAWRMRSSSRVNGRNRCSAMSAGTTAPVLTTRRTDVASWVIVEISMVPPAML